MKCGYIALIGAPNAGKSTLLNAFLKRKLSIVSNKPHTTRQRILGIVTQGDAQLLFLDTPGFAASHTLLKSIPWEACEDADIICYLVDITRGWQKQDTVCLQKLQTYHTKKIFILGTKTDKLKKHDVSKIMLDIQKHLLEITQKEGIEIPQSEPLPLHMISAKKPEDVSLLLSIFSANAPKSEWLYEKNSVTDSPPNFICAEFIREQLFRQLGEELPYQVTVIIEKLENLAKFVHIHATIIVIRESQKAIIIGRGGSRLKTIGQLSRESLEKYFGKKVVLKIFVKKGNI